MQRGSLPVSRLQRLRVHRHFHRVQRSEDLHLSRRHRLQALPVGQLHVRVRRERGRRLVCACSGQLGRRTFRVQRKLRRLVQRMAPLHGAARGFCRAVPLRVEHDGREGHSRLRDRLQRDAVRRHDDHRHLLQCAHERDGRVQRSVCLRRLGQREFDRQPNGDHLARADDHSMQLRRDCTVIRAEKTRTQSRCVHELSVCR